MRCGGGGWAGGESEGKRVRGGVKEERKTGAVGAGRNIYDRWAPRFSLTPVKPMPRFRAPVDCIGAVHPRLLQKSI